MLPASGEAAVGSSRTRFTVFRLQSARPFWAADGDVESNSRLAEDALTCLKSPALPPRRSGEPPSTGLLQAFLLVGRERKPLDSRIRTGACRFHCFLL